MRNAILNERTRSEEVAATKVSPDGLPVLVGPSKKSDVIPLKNRFMDRLNKIAFTPGAGVSPVDFVDKTFLPACDRRLSGGGAKCYRDTWKCQLKHHVVVLRLRDARPVHLQNLLNAVEQEHGTSLAHGTYKTMKVTLSAIFTEARNLGLYVGTNPRQASEYPRDESTGAPCLRPGRDPESILSFSRRGNRRSQASASPEKIWTPSPCTYTEGQLALLQEGTHTPNIDASTIRAIIGVTAFAGLRKGEIRGLWNDDREAVLAICRSVWRSTVKNTGTEEDIDDPGLVLVIQPLRLLLDAIKQENAAVFIFFNRVGGALDPDNLADRAIQPTPEANGLE